jgi:hypothetical protein
MSVLSIFIDKNILLFIIIIIAVCIFRAKVRYVKIEYEYVNSNIIRIERPNDFQALFCIRDR